MASKYELSSPGRFPSNGGYDVPRLSQLPRLELALVSRNQRLTTTYLGFFGLLHMH